MLRGATKGGGERVVARMLSDLLAEDSELFCLGVSPAEPHWGHGLAPLLWVPVFSSLVVDIFLLVFINLKACGNSL